MTRIPYFALALLVAVAADAVEPVRPEPVCPAPVSTCQTPGPDGTSCPSGYRCTCVPSCPTCADCAAQVCVAELSQRCRTACDCSPGLTCSNGQCITGTAPVFCCESDRCPVGQQCEHADGRADRCGRQCETACDCDAGRACIDGQCIAGFAPVYCCEGDQCPTGQQCQHRDGRQDRCGQGCLSTAWRCETPGSSCGQDRVCACSASCPDCEDCGPGVCMPRGSAAPYRCATDGSCSQAGDRCLCVSSCPDCDDCALSVCVPSCEPMCDRAERVSSRRIDRIVELSRQCHSDSECVHVGSSSGCRETCGAWVSSRYAQRVGRLIEYLDQRYCASFQGDGCTTSAPQCTPERGACIDGQCSGVALTP